MKLPTREDAVANFNRAADNPTWDKGGDLYLHAVNFQEEVGELGTAINEYVNNPTDETRRAFAKEWADVQVVLSNLAWFFALDGEEAFRRVHANNMSKLVEGKLIKNEYGKVLKPEGYVKPDMSGL